MGMNGWLTQRHVSIFGEDADSFRPERWLRGEGESEVSWQARLLAMKRATMVFGYGSRACLGKGVALLEIYKSVPALVQAFHVSFPSVSEFSFSVSSFRFWIRADLRP